jgi:hypothetical protein
LYSERPLDEVIAAYRNDLEGIIVSLQGDLDSADIDKSAPQVKRISLLSERLNACYAISSDPDYIATLATPRQQARPDSIVASDILVMPQMEQGFSLQANGRIRLATEIHTVEALNYGVATCDPQMLRGMWHSAPDGTSTPDPDAMHLARTRLLEAVEPVLFI